MGLKRITTASGCGTFGTIKHDSQLSDERRRTNLLANLPHWRRATGPVTIDLSVRFPHMLFDPRIELTLPGSARYVARHEQSHTPTGQRHPCWRLDYLEAVRSPEKLAEDCLQPKAFEHLRRRRRAISQLSPPTTTS
ncbi:MAG: hypothetical protein ACLP75_25430 [Mycobacterium sp.]|uniref:hypothetical protein n=1 Tax=Mycobacterium sp. TaxID=1785 RepID=UPI003F9CB2D5